MSALGLYFYNVFHSVYTVLVGMSITLRHLFTRSATVQYPSVKLILPDRARNRLFVNIDDCIGCGLCETACPVDCIMIETIKSTPDADLGMTSNKTRKRLYVPKFDIDIAKCCYCGLCVPPCPTKCIVMTDVYEFSEFDRNKLIYSFSNMTSEETAAAREALSRYETEQALKKSAAQAGAKQGMQAKPGKDSPHENRPTKLR
jgi:NADH-quinone oxidoreductase chain I